MAQVDLTKEEGVAEYLRSKHYSCSSVERLAEGVSGFVYRAHLNKTSNNNVDQPSTIIVKHVEGFAARWPEFKIAQDRMDYEARALFFLSQPHFLTTFPLTHTPTLLHYDKPTHTLLLSDSGALPSLKTWLQPTSPSPQVESIGKALGTYLAHIHNQTASDAATKAAFAGNLAAKKISAAVYYGGLAAAAARYGYEDSFISEAAKAAEEEVMSSEDVWTLGDFWTGNVLVADPVGDAEPALTVLDLELAKPGTAAFDVGQMAAEMWCLARFRCEENGGLLLESFLRAYRGERKGSVDFAGVAVRVGAHLVTMLPRAWGEVVGDEAVVGGVREGVELVRMGWERDEVALRGSVLGALMG